MALGKSSTNEHMCKYTYIDFLKIKCVLRTVLNVQKNFKDGTMNPHNPKVSSSINYPKCIFATVNGAVSINALLLAKVYNLFRFSSFSSNILFSSRIPSKITHFISCDIFLSSSWL